MAPPSSARFAFSSAPIRGSASVRLAGHRSLIAQSCNVSIPLSAVLYGEDSAFVAVVRNDRIETRQIVLGQLAEGDAEIREGLAEGDLVVARAGAFFREGDRVRPFLAGAPAGK